MNQTVPRCKIEILLPELLLKRIIGIAESAGITGYTIIPTLGGAGVGGTWSDDQLSGAEARAILIIITSIEKAEALTQALAPLLQSHSLLLTQTSVDVVRGQKF